MILEGKKDLSISSGGPLGWDVRAVGPIIMLLKAIQAKAQDVDPAKEYRWHPVAG
jgi:hypothetical protein